MAKVKLLLDEDIQLDLASALRKRGKDGAIANKLSMLSSRRVVYLLSM